MNTEEAKAYVNERFSDLKEDNPTWSRASITNLILNELRVEHNYVLTAPFGHPIVGISEDAKGIVYHVTGLKV